MRCPNCGANYDGQTCLMCGYRQYAPQYPSYPGAQSTVVMPSHQGIGAGGLVIVVIVIFILALLFVFLLPSVLLGGTRTACGILIPLVLMTLPAILLWRKRSG